MCVIINLNTRNKETCSAVQQLRNHYVEYEYEHCYDVAPVLSTRSPISCFVNRKTGAVGHYDAHMMTPIAVAERAFAYKNIRASPSARWYQKCARLAYM